MFIPFARLFGKKVLLQTHGLDWKREKWNSFAKFIIKISTRLGLWFTDNIAAVSLEEVEYFEKYFKKQVAHLPNGISIPEPATHTNEIEKFNIKPTRYILFLSRLVPEKGCHYLIDAWDKLDPQLKSEYKLVIAGDTQYKDKYYYSLKDHKSQNIIFTGFATGELKRQLLTHAGLFVQPSTIEGMPISVLEAMGYGIPVIASNIREISDIVINKELLFEVGNSESLNKILSVVLMSVEVHKQFALEKRGEILAKYNWDTSAKVLDGLIENFK